MNTEYWKTITHMKRHKRYVSLIYRNVSEFSMRDATDNSQMNHYSSLGGVQITVSSYICLDFLL